MSSPRPSLAVVTAVAALTMGASTGCYRVTVKSGLPEAQSRPAMNGASRGGYFNGVFEDDPVHVAGVCKGGWSSVHIETGFLNGLVDAMRGLYYHVDNVTLVCAPEPVTAAAPPETIAPATAPPAAPPPVAPAQAAPVTAAATARTTTL